MVRLCWKSTGDRRFPSQKASNAEIFSISWCHLVSSGSICTWETHWGRVTHICDSKLTIIGSDKGLASGRRQAIIRSNAGMLLNGHIGTNFSEIVIEIPTFAFKKTYFKMPSAKGGHFISASMWSKSTRTHTDLDATRTCVHVDEVSIKLDMLCYSAKTWFPTSFD